VSANDFNHVVEVYDRAIKARDGLQFANAVSLFQQAAAVLGQLQTNLPFQVAFAYDMAVAYDLAGQASQAKQLFEKAVQLYDQFRATEPDHDAVEGFSGLIWGINDYLELVRNANLQANNYLDSITPRRWQTEQLPLKIFIDHTAATGFDTTMRSIIADAFHKWVQNQTFLKSVETNDQQQAQIIVTRIADGLGSAGGHTAFEDATGLNGQTQLRLVTIRISMHSHESTAYSDSELQAFKSLTLHEAGHALGLDGHSPHATDLMYWKSPLLKLSDPDIETMRMLYSND
jgi:tetratricopeptide (TPR) repeat protein